MMIKLRDFRLIQDATGGGIALGDGCLLVLPNEATVDQEDRLYFASNDKGDWNSLSVEVDVDNFIEIFGRDELLLHLGVVIVDDEPAPDEEDEEDEDEDEDEDEEPGDSEEEPDTTPPTPIPGGGSLVDGPAELRNALAQGGAFQLKPGDYGDVLDAQGSGVPLPRGVTISAADPIQMPKFGRIYQNGVADAALHNLHFTHTTNSPFNSAIHQFWNSNNIAAIGCHFEGSFDNGAGHGLGLTFWSCDDVHVEACEFEKYWTAYRHVIGKRANFLSNDLHTIRSDGCFIGDLEYAMFHGNHFHDFKDLASSSDHKDMFQITRLNQGCHDLDILNNVFDIAGGSWTQTIWSGGDGKDHTGTHIHRRVRIENNIIHNAFRYGITLHGVDGLDILNNTVITHPPEPFDVATGIEIWSSQNVNVSGNITPAIRNYSNAGNAIIPASQYGEAFIQSKNGTLNDWKVKRGGPAEGFGSSLMGIG